MSESSSTDIKIDFVNELKDYIPELRDKTSRLEASGVEMSEDDLTGLHRLVHTIRGAAALIRLNNLSEVASEFEELIDEVIQNRLTYDSTVSKVFVNSIEFFNAYSQQVPCNDSFAPDRRTEIIDALREVREQAAMGDGPDMLSKLLMTALQDENDDLLLASGENAIDDIDLGADHLVADEDDITALGELDCLDDSPLYNNEPMPVQETNRPGEDIGEDDNDLDFIDLPQEELLEGFYLEAEDHFQDLGKALGSLEDQINTSTALTTGLRELLRIIRRSVHTIKGAAAVIQLKDIAGWGHEFEDVLDWLYEDAKILTPEMISVIAAAADLLEGFVSTPNAIDALQRERLRDEFKLMIGSDAGPCSMDINEPAVDTPMTSTEYVEVVLPEIQQERQNEVERRNAGAQAPSFALDQSKTLRVDMAKLESLVNLGGELTIGLSAFDQDMDGLGNLIGEIDRARARLQRTARDLELGYEVKAIQKLGASPSMVEAPSAAIGDPSAAFADFDLLELDRYSELNLIIRSLSETAVDVSTISRQLSDIYSGFDAYLNRLRVLLSEFHEKAMRIRMTPMSTMINRMRRTVRETAAHLDKKVHFSIDGEHIELDKMVWEKLADPLMHLLRNAIDHGIESPATRKEAGKPEIGNVHLTAAYQGNQVVIRVTDDGAGLDYDNIRETVASTQSGKNFDAQIDNDPTDIIFQPGFSTRHTISEVSGRGVGLDVVKGNIHGLKGNVRIETSAKGSGTTFRINLPLTMAVMQALLFDVGGQRYATALYDIKEILRVNPKDIASQDDHTITIAGRRMPFYRLHDQLAHTISDAQAGEKAKWPLVLIADTESWQGAVAIDRIYSQREIVIKSLGTHLHHVKGIAGATVMGDGEVVPILNLEELLRVKIDREHQPVQFQSPKIPKSLNILVVDDSVSVRMVVSRLMQRQGWKVRTAKDGVEAIERLHARQPDLIVLDVEMPRMNGYDFMSSIRAQSKFKNTPVIMLTSRATKKHREKAEALGVSGFVTKPYDDEAFVALVKRLSLETDFNSTPDQRHVTQR